MLELQTVTRSEIDKWEFIIRPKQKRKELTDADWNRILLFIRGIVAKMIHLLPWNDRSPMTFEDWVQVGSVAVCRMVLRPDCPQFDTPGFWKLAATYIRQDVRNEVQKLTTQGRNINATENTVEVDACTFSSDASHFEPDSSLIKSQTYSILREAAKKLSSKHSELLEYLIQGYTRSDFLHLCKLLKVEPKLLNVMWSELQSQCYAVAK